MSYSCIDCRNDNCLIKKNIEHIEAFDAQLIQQKHTVQCKKGAQFIMEGAPVNGLYFVYKGTVKVLKTGYNGKEQILRLSKEGEIIGHRGFGTGETYQIGGTALEDTILCNFSKSMLATVLQNVPKVAYEFMIFYAQELNRSETKVKTMSQMTVREKVIDMLFYLFRKFGNPLNNTIELELSRKELADYAGTSDEQVIRILSALKKEKLIYTKSKTITILNFEKLKKEIAEHHFFLDS
ncbi:Crp/Fnr family transcriptional regulator [Flavobacterium agrisoli]|uniref:Crp/Fnr family transcriptional regulator n=1 Tax=Flavobacterium agrisoli TaxID=2793066 RepID=A0A934PMS0_9FLAO|nr:Crp/Fnr family transcriptional regulator [Flavobacterium agrisoli]MBK0369710.1 Crp/Fnr family transcriptional regulator [Flavobacterium agrisoli]